MDSQSIDELVTLRARVAELEASIAAHFAKVHGPESITACEAVTRLGEYAAKLQEAEKERDAWKKIASDADEFRPLYEKAEAKLAESEKGRDALAEQIRTSGHRHEGGGPPEPTTCDCCMCMRAYMEPLEAKLAQQAEALRAAREAVHRIDGCEIIKNGNHYKLNLYELKEALAALKD